MKPRHMTIALIVCISTFSACEKKYCWKCAMTTVTRSSPINGITIPVTTDTATNNFSVCDQTATGIKAYEKNTSSDQTEGNIIVNTLTTTTCNQ